MQSEPIESPARSLRIQILLTGLFPREGWRRPEEKSIPNHVQQQTPWPQDRETPPPSISKQTCRAYQPKKKKGRNGVVLIADLRVQNAQLQALRSTAVFILREKFRFGNPLNSLWLVRVERQLVSQSPEENADPQRAKQNGEAD